LTTRQIEAKQKLRFLRLTITREEEDKRGERERDQAWQAGTTKFKTFFAEYYDN